MGRCRSRPGRRAGRAGPAPGKAANVTAGESLEASQAALNEIAAAMIEDSPGDREFITRVRDALRQHSWARGFPFEDVPPPHRDQLTPGARREIAVLATQALQAAIRADAARAKAIAVTCKSMTPDDAASLCVQGAASRWCR